MPKKTRHGVFIKYGVIEFQLTADELQLIADALDIINPDSTEQMLLARKLSASFLALSEYAEWANSHIFSGVVQPRLQKRKTR